MDSVLIIALEGLIVATGRFSLWALSLGRLGYEPMGGDPAHSRTSGGLWYVQDGRRVVTYAGQLAAGMACCGIAIVTGILYAVAL